MSKFKRKAKRSSRFIDITGQHFSRWTVISFAGIKNSHTYWNCICVCGTIKIINGDNIKSGKSRSCGCMPKSYTGKIKHNKCHTPEYKIWAGLINRCENKNNYSYNDYGGRGISVCTRWRKSFILFLEDMGKRPDPKLSIERRDNNGNYEPENCYWATQVQQKRNTRTMKNNKTGIRGINLTEHNKYQVRIGINKKQIIIGSFSSIKKAAEARKQAEIRYWSDGDGLV